jgi:hypothetical protein
MADPTQRATPAPGYVICREANGGYRIDDDQHQLYFASIAELEDFLDRAIIAAQFVDEAHALGVPHVYCCPLVNQTGMDGVCDFVGVLARLSPEAFADFERERAARQAELQCV